MRIDKTGVLNTKPDMSESNKEVTAGDLIKGKVIEADGSSITIRTSGGQILSAILKDGIKVSKGALVELLVNSVIEGKIYAELKADSKSIDLNMKIAELLKQLNLPVDENNIDAAKLLIKYKLPVDRETITSITALQKSIGNLSQNSEGRAALLLSGMDIKNTPVDVLNRIVLNWPVEKTEGTVEMPSGGNVVNTAAIDAAAIGLTEPEKPEADLSEMKTTIAADIKESASISSDTGKMIKAESTKSDIAHAGVKPEGGIAASLKDSKEVSGNDGSEMLKGIGRLGINPDKQVTELADKVAAVLASIRDADMEAITYMFSKEIEVTPKNLGMLLRNIRNSDGISQLLDKIQQKIINNDSPELKEIKDTIKSIFIKPEELEDAEEVSDKLKDIVRLGEKLEGYLNRNENKDPEIKSMLSNLRDNIDFIKSINQHANYLQIPVMINGDPSTAKLYIFKEGKRSSRIDPEDATIVVALDLKSLGHLESMIKVKDKSVNVTFRVENKDIGVLLEKHFPMLKDSLKEKGYILNPIRIIDLEQPFSVISLEEMINEATSGKIHFDMRI